jgi:hypothetical protein
MRIRPLVKIFEPLLSLCRLWQYSLTSGVLDRRRVSFRQLARAARRRHLSSEMTAAKDRQERGGGTRSCLPSDAIVHVTAHEQGASPDPQW